MKTGDAMSVVILGVRHHSPACARLVGHTIERVRPRVVLIEGPADMNGRIGELQLPHELPIAVFTYRAEGAQSQSSWTPLCAHSPEWVALETAARVGAEARFMDLPGWDPAFWGIRNRYADRVDRTERLAARLCARFGVSDVDALWEHLFEQPMPEEELERRLRAYFDELRGDDPADERDAPREAFMAACLAAARDEGGPVVAVCGGWHAPALVRSIAGDAARPARWPVTPPPPDGIRAGSYLVPYSFHRLDSFTGYESGMPSPAYQDAAHREGPARASDILLASTVERLRRRRAPVSAADLIAVSAMADGLRRVRGHRVISRIDLLDGLAAGLIKSALEVPLPWTYRGTIKPRTDPLLVEIVAAFAGDKVGRLADGTPRPPLLASVGAELEAHDLAPGATPRTVEIDLTRPRDLARSRVLHRLRVLEIPGFLRVRGPIWPTDGTLIETWMIEHTLEADGALIEAAVYGGTLEDAATGRLEELMLMAGGRLSRLAELLAEAAYIGIDRLAARVLADLARAVGTEPVLAELGQALASLLGLWTYDVLLGAAGSPALGAVIAGAFNRGLWLAEGLRGSAAPDMPSLTAVMALRDALRHAGAALALDRPHAHAVMDRRRHDAQAPPAVRGAALGFLWSTGFFTSVEAGAGEGIRSVRARRPAPRRSATS